MGSLQTHGPGCHKASLARSTRPPTDDNRHLKKPRSLERRLLSAFLGVYDSYIYTMFLRIYNRQIVQETIPPPGNQLSRHLIGLWDVLNRSIENYELYVNMMVDMRDTFFGPVMEELARCPELWQESWDRHQEQGLEKYVDYVSEGQAW